MSELQGWHGLSHKQAWGDLGSSYADLNERQARHAAVARTVRSNAAVDMQKSAAGVESAARPKGAGTFQMQVRVEVLARAVR